MRVRQRRVSIPKLKDVNKKNEEFGLSLMLSNVPGGPMSPKFINGTYAALFEEGSDELFESAKNYKANQKGGGGGGAGGGGATGSMDAGDMQKFKGRLAGMKQMSLDMDGDAGHGGGSGVKATKEESKGGEEKKTKKKAISKQGSLDTKIEDIIEGEIPVWFFSLCPSLTMALSELLGGVIECVCV